MGKLIYTAIMSLDGFVEDLHGKFDWAMPDDEVHSCVNNLELGIGTYLLGRRMYQTMAVWDQIYGQTDLVKVMRDYAAIWHGMDKIVYSGTLDHATTDRTRIERVFDPQEVRQMKVHAAENR